MTRAFFPLLRLELADALRSRWLVFTAVVYTVVFGVFVWLGLRESTVLGFTGMSRVVLNLSNALVLTVPLVALIATNQSIVRARTSGFFEMFLTQPARRLDWFAAAVLSRLVVVVAPLCALLSAAIVAQAFVGDDAALLPIVARSLLVTGALAFAFVGAGFLVSCAARTSERATVLALVVWLGASLLHDFALVGALLQWRLPPQLVFALAALNPSEAGRLAILSGVDPELSVLGPVGFWLANHLGAGPLLLVGAAWPALLGAATLALAARRLQRTDLLA